MARGWALRGRGSGLCAVLPGAGVTLGKDAPDLTKEFPNVDAWMQRMGGRASVTKVAGARAQVLKAQAQQGNPQVKAYTGPRTST